MTDLRRTAQLIDDLHVLGVLEKSDSICWSNTDDLGIVISIQLNPKELTGYIEGRLHTIRKEIQEEFPEENLYFLPDIENAIICKLCKKE